MAAVWYIKHRDTANMIVATLSVKESELVVSQNGGRIANKKRL